MKSPYCLILFCLAPLLLAQDHGHGHPVQAHTATTGLMATLSPELQELLRKEMQLLLDGLGSLSREIPQGRWQSVAEIAAKMRDSFILKKSLTPGQKEELMAKLPPEFIHLDQQFHQTAGKLAQVAHERDVELSIFYQARIIDSCTSCHAHFAPKRFPGLVQEKAVHQH